MGSVRGQEVAPEVYRFGTDRINWYIIVDGTALTILDTGLPGHWQQLVDGVRALGHRFSDIEAVLLTHGDLDHIGFAEWLRQTTDAPVWIHPADIPRANTMSRSLPPKAFFTRPLNPSALSYVLEVVRSGVRAVQPITAFEPFEDGDELDVPGQPSVIHLPGHTAGSAAFYLPDQEVLFCGDALVTYDVFEGMDVEPSVLPPTHYDVTEAHRSIRKLAHCGDVVLLPGHGEPWHGDIAEITGDRT